MPRKKVTEESVGKRFLGMAHFFQTKAKAAARADKAGDVQKFTLSSAIALDKWRTTTGKPVAIIANLHAVADLPALSREMQSILAESEPAGARSAKPIPPVRGLALPQSPEDEEDNT